MGSCAQAEPSGGLTFQKGACCLCGGEAGDVVAQISCAIPGATSQVFSFIECPKCRILFLDPRPTSETLHLAYPDEEYYSRNLDKLHLAAGERSNGLKARLQSRIMQAYGLVEGKSAHGFCDIASKMTIYPLLIRFSALLGTLIYNREVFRFSRYPARVLEVGFGNGLLLYALSHLDVELFGTEISQKACDAAASGLGAKTFCGQMWEANYDDGQFDLVIFSHSLEHLEDPMKALHEARRVLAPDGRLFISAPNPDCLSARILKSHWLGYDAPRHLFLFGRRGLKKMASEAGFEMEKVTFPLEGSVHHLIGTIHSALGFRVFPTFVERSLPAQALYAPIAMIGAGDVLSAVFRRC